MVGDAVRAWRLQLSTQDLPGPRRRGRRRHADFETECGTRPQTAASLPSYVSLLDDCVQKLDNVTQRANALPRGMLRVYDYLHFSLLLSHQPDDATALYFRRGSMLACAIPPTLSSRHHSEDGNGYILPLCQNPLFIPEAVVSPKSENVFRVGSLASVLRRRTHRAYTVPSGPVPPRSLDIRSHGPGRSEIEDVRRDPHHASTAGIGCLSSPSHGRRHRRASDEATRKSGLAIGRHRAPSRVKTNSRPCAPPPARRQRFTSVDRGFSSPTLRPPLSDAAMIILLGLSGLRTRDQFLYRSRPPLLSRPLPLPTTCPGRKWIRGRVP
ncbi:hypothetical protein K438DRAFT_1969621 [Mycena galopus ATCC 62051]|nr:hypothetical protein K438DRAFT_1969621 [Mycena galopus ATCC 62051]